ncbi:MAG: glycosyl transferase family 90 [Chthoniobacterales bacterium]
MAQGMGEEWGDIGLAALFHITEADVAEVRDLQLVKEKVRWKQLSNYRFHIDIDGHTSSFSGLFRKLLSGGLVLKVQSPEGCRPWYYDQLVSGVNFVPVSSDLSDLVDIVSYYRERPRLAESIAQRGRALALTLTYEKEFASALRTVTRAFAAANP